MAGLVPAINVLRYCVWKKDVDARTRPGMTVERYVPLEYSVFIEPLAEKDGGGYLATVPELPGCMSDGETPEEALKNVKEAIWSWVEAANAREFDLPKSD